MKDMYGSRMKTDIYDDDADVRILDRYQVTDSN